MQCKKRTINSLELTILTSCNRHRSKMEKRRENRVRQFNHAMRKKNHHPVHEILSSRELTILTSCNHQRRKRKKEGKTVLDGSTVIKTSKTTTLNVPIYGMGTTTVLKENSLKTKSLYHRYRFCARRERSGPEVCIETTTGATTISKQFSIPYFPNAMRWEPTMGGAWWGSGMVEQRRAPFHL